MRLPTAAWDTSTVSIRDGHAWTVAGMLAAVAFAAALCVHVWVLQRFANSGDENAYVWQATAFAQGMVTAASPEPVEAFRVNHIGDVGGRRFSKYPPGWPLLLSAGVMVGIAGAVNPLLAALALGGIYRLGCCWIGRRAALLGAIVVLATPFFLLNAGSFHSHPSCLFALTVMALCLTWADDGAGSAAFVLAGMAFGLAVLIRPFTAILIAVPLLVGFASAFRAGLLRKLLAFALGGLPCALFLATVNTAVTGAWWQLAWNHYDPSEALGFGSYGHSLLQGMKTTLRLGAEGVLYTCVVGVLLVMLSWSRRFPYRRLSWVLLLAPVIGYVFWWSHGGNRYGPRFYFEALLPFALLAGAGAERVLSWTRARAVVVFVVIVWVAITGVLMTAAHRQVHARRDLYDRVEQAALTNAIVLLETASSDMVRIDLTRNPPDFSSAPVLYALSGGTAENAMVERAHPGRTVYRYRWTPQGGYLSPISR